MKPLYFLLPFLLLVGCGQRPFQTGAAEFIDFRTGPSASTLLVGKDHKGKKSSATHTFRYRDPQVALYDSYIVITYPGTDSPDKVIPRESLIEMEWKK